jgi:CRP-like cAMP-binding protein
MSELDPQKLRQYTPLHAFSDEKLLRLTRRLTIEEIPKGATLCQEGGTDNDAIYLIEGGVQLQSRATTLARALHAGAPEAYFPLAPGRPRPYTVTAVTPVRVFRVDNVWLDRALLLDEVTTTITRLRGDGVRFSGDSEWIEEMLATPAFRRLPWKKLSQLLMRLEPVSVHASEAVIRQSAPGDFYYIVKDGRFAVSRKDGQGKVHILSELKSGAVFGEEALIAGMARNASVIALEDGIVMRLGKADFDALLREPLLSYVTQEEARQMVRGGALLIDVREPAEFQRGAIKGSINIPLFDLRRRSAELDLQRPCVVYCNRGVQSEIAAFLLNQRGLNAHVLVGGMESLASQPGTS